MVDCGPRAKAENYKDFIPMRQPADMSYRNPLFYVLTQVIGITALLGWIAYTVQHSSLDIAIGHFFYDPVLRVFPMRQQPVAQMLGILAGLVLPLVCVGGTGVAAVLSIWHKPLKPMRAVLWCLFAVFCLIPVAVEVLKQYTALPRPFSLSMFGGEGQIPEMFWARGVRAGQALPSYFAATGYALFGLYFAGWALNRPSLRWGGVALAAAAGLLFGLVRTMEGAHFFSQTLWSAALAWLICSVVFFPVIVTRHRPSINENDYTLDDIWTHLSGVQAQRRKTLTIYGVLLVGLLPFMASSWRDDSWIHLTVEWVGLLLILVAVLGRCWCILYLGGHKGSNLIRQGPYSLSRNPLYLFSMIAVAGIGAQSGSLLLGPILALFVYAVFNNVIDEEERLLRKVFGPEFDVYRSEVPRFGPRFANWQAADELTISMSALGNTMRDALPYFLALPLFELIERAQESGWLPVLIQLP